MAPDKKKIIKDKIKKKEVASIREDFMKRAKDIKEKWNEKNTP